MALDPLSQRAANLRALGFAVAPVSNGPVTTYNPVQQYQSVLNVLKREASKRSPDPVEAARARVRERAEARQPQKTTGGRLGWLANNPVTSTLAKGLSYLDMPRRVAISALQEGIDAIGSGDASWDDFVNQVKDESFGFGTVVGDLTDNKWVNRAIGFLGDVALDPLTYVTFGAGRFAGQGGRAAAAQAAARAGLADDLVAKLGREGVSALSQAERRAFNEGLERLGQRGIGEAGLRFGTSRNNIRLPGTGGLARAIARPAAELRAQAWASRPGEAIMRRTGNAATLDARRALQLGGDHRLSATDAARFLSGFDEGQRIGRMHQGVWDRTIGEKWARTPAAERRAFTHAVEAGGAQYSGFDDIAARAELFGVQVPRLSTGQPYVPHFISDEARKVGVQTSEDQVQRVISEVTGSTNLQVRRWRPDMDVTVETPSGKYTFNTGDGTIASINRNASAVVPELRDKRLLEDDILVIETKYADNLSRDIERMQRLKYINQAYGGDDAAYREVLDEAAMRREAELIDAAARQRAEGFNQEALRLGERVGELLERARTQGRRISANEREALARGSERARAELKLTQDQIRAVEALIGKQGRVAQELSGLRGRYDELGAAMRQRKEQYAADRGRRARLPEEERFAALETHRRNIANLRKERKRINRAVQRRERQIAAIDRELSRYGVEPFDERYRRQTLSTFEKNLQSRREVNRKLNQRLKAGKRADTQLARYKDSLAELEDFRLLYGTDPAYEPVMRLLSEAEERLAEMERSVNQWKRFKSLAEADHKELNAIVKLELEKGWKTVGEELNGQGIAIPEQLADVLIRFEKQLEDKRVWRMFDDYTRLFKTYATLSPGFHVRNGYGALFMNMSEGVGVGRHLEAIKLFKRFRDDPAGVLDNLTPRERAALEVMFASGAAGGVSADEILVRGNRLQHNIFTRKSAAVGQWVEGPARLALALDAIDRGMGFSEALARVKRVHFDYSDLSRFDQTMKRLIPFWTFMRRNLPLQLTQIIHKPKAYNHYLSFVRNMHDDKEGELYPLWWAERNAFRLGELGGDSWYAMPDLPFINLGEDVSRLNPLDPMRALSNANPLIRVPLETLVAERKFFSDTPIQGGLDAKAWYAIQQMIPTVSQGQRVIGLDVTDNDTYGDRQLQSVLNYLGLPLRNLTDDMEARERKYAKYRQER